MEITQIIKSVNHRHLAGLERYTTLIHLFGEYSPFMGLLVLELTYRCNLSCKMCPQAADRNIDAPPERMRDMPMEILRRVLDDAYEHCWPRPFVHLFGGEPMLHRNFIDVIAYIKSKKMRCSITTNGFLLERYASDITRLGLDRIRISLDGPEEIHNEIRGSKVSYQKAMQGLKAIQKEKDSRNKKVPSIAVNCVITQYNYQRLLDVVDEMAEVGVKTLTFQHLMFDDFTGHGIDVEHFIQMIPALEKKAKQNGIFLTFYPQMNISQIRNYYNNTVAHLGGSCVLPWFVTRVQADGSITCCRDFIYGNVMDEDFSVKKIWNNELIGNYRKSIVTNGLFSDCGRCCHRLYIE